MIETGTPVPEVDVYDAKGAASLPVFFSGPTLLLFFRAACRRCQGMLGLVAGIGRLARGLTVIGVSQETIEETAELLQGIGVRLPVVIDDRPYPAAAVFEIESLPALALIEDDRVAWTSDGCPPGDLEELTERIGPWTRSSAVALHPDYLDAEGSASKHRPQEP